MKKTTKQRLTGHISLRAEPELVRLLAAVSRRRRTSKGALIRSILKEALK